jgi:hypothetical protein
VGATRDRDFTGYRCLDANIEGLNFLARPENVAALLDRAAEVRARVEAATIVTTEDELLYQIALAAEGVEPDFASRAIEIFREPGLFYHYPTYRQAVLAMTRWQRLLTLDGVPRQYNDFQVFAYGLANFDSYQDMCDPATIDRITRPFVPYIEGPFAEVLRSQDWELIGFSVNYTSQLPFALRLAAEARATCPRSVIVFGGTEVCDNVRFARQPADVWRLFRDADVIVPGEGETPLCSIMEAIRDRRPLQGIRGAMVRGNSTAGAPINYENVAALPSPAYDVWDWGAYWSPEPVILYSPTRGCYWNKCTFCDYGLNSDRPTSPSRDRPVEAVIADLTSVSEIGRLIYFAVDAMSPRYLRALCRAIAESPVDINWSAELRLERTFPKTGMANLLRQSGCLAVSFGYESGSQRILDLIDKGVSLAEVPKILRDLNAHGIAAQMMGFTGFPSETPQEAEQTYRFLDQHRELWAIAGISKFILTPGSIVAKQPERFGVTVLPSPLGVDVDRYLPWFDRALGVERWPGDVDGVPPEIRALASREIYHRPFVGGIDTGHTMLYFRRNGPALLPSDSGGPPLRLLVRPHELEIPFADLSQFIVETELEAQFFDTYRQGGATAETMMAWLRQPGRAQSGTSNVLVLPAGNAVPLPAGRRDVLRDAVLISARKRGWA